MFPKGQSVESQVSSVAKPGNRAYRQQMRSIFFWNRPVFLSPTKEREGEYPGNWHARPTVRGSETQAHQVKSNQRGGTAEKGAKTLHNQYITELILPPKNYITLHYF